MRMADITPQKQASIDLERARETGKPEHGCNNPKSETFLWHRLCVTPLPSIRNIATSQRARLASCLGYDLSSLSLYQPTSELNSRTSAVCFSCTDSIYTSAWSREVLWKYKWKKIQNSQENSWLRGTNITTENNRGTEKVKWHFQSVYWGYWNRFMISCRCIFEFLYM